VVWFGPRRHRRSRIAAERGLIPADDGPGASLTDVAVAPALELAWLVAQQASQASPGVPFPRTLRPLLGFSKLGPKALATIRRAVEGDEQFRATVASGAPTDEVVGRLGWLFLHRPDGWEEEAVMLARAQAERHVAQDGRRSDRAAERLAAKLESARLRADAAADAARVDAAVAARQLAEERRSRRAAEAAAESLRRKVASLEGERDSARRRTAAADERAVLTAELEGRLLLAEAAAAASAEALLGARAALVEARSAAQAAVTNVTAAQTEAAAAVADGARTAADLGAVLARAAEALRGPPVDVPPVALPPPPDGGPSRPAGQTRRRPATLPPAVFDDSAEAAEYLVRRPGALVLVDGYNATISAWSHLPIAEQRGRLLDAAGELAARTGAKVHVVFDGAEQPGPAPGPQSRRSVRWRFSSPDVEADEVLLDMVDDAPVDRVVVVASSDRRVRDGVRARGANAISTPQLFAVLRRDLGTL
jgi:predicted RNA-binding protein with PIN domain